MARSQEQISPERLCEAAEAALRAAVEVAEYTGGPWPYPADLMGGPLQPDYLAGFTRWEMEQASEFLVRLGMIDRPSPKKAG
jgi:hypothetical protein